MIGQSLGRYHILEQLGEGGMATVYKAYDTRLEREVAIKIIRKSAFSSEVLEQVLKRFEREAKALARLNHTNIVHILDFGEYEGIPYLVMDYLPGGTLKPRLGRSIPWQTAMQLLLPIARALDHAHRQGMIHRDVKPANILITTDGQPMLSDFGIAKILESDETLTGTGVGIGTPEYMSPEQGLGKKVDGRADVYSLGIILFEMLVGRKPFKADTPMAVVVSQINDPLPQPRQFVPGLPDGVERILFKALAKKPEDRYPDMGQFAAAMEAQLAGISAPSQPQAGKIDSRRMTAPVAAQPAALQPRPVGYQSTAKKPTWLPWAIGFFVIGVLVVWLAGSKPALNLAMRPLTPTLPFTSTQTPRTSNTPLTQASSTPVYNPAATTDPLINEIIGIWLYIDPNPPGNSDIIVTFNIDNGFSITGNWGTYIGYWYIQNGLIEVDYGHKCTFKLDGSIMSTCDILPFYGAVLTKKP